jgi:carboxymethylenebutenolidase
MKDLTVTVHGSSAGSSAPLAIPEEGKGPGLILLTDPEISDEWARQTARLMAEEGYVTLALSVGGSDAGQVAAVAHAAELLADRHEVDGPVGLLGFGRGANVGWHAAAQGLVKCAVLYAPALATDSLPVPQVPIMAHLGEAALALLSHPTLRQNRNVTLFGYPSAGTSFACQESPEYVRPAAMMAYSRSLSLLRRVLGPHIDLEALWDTHLSYEFGTKDPDATIATMVEDAYVNHIPNMTGGVGREYLYRFYKHHFIPRTPDVELIPISRTVGTDRVVDEFISLFTHDREIDWFLPGIPATGKRIEVACVSIVCFRGRKLYHEHIYWDQASVFVQIGLLDPAKLPVAGRESAMKVLDKTRPSNELMPTWSKSEGLPGYAATRAGRQ